MEQISEEAISASYQSALKDGLIDVADTAVIFIDFDIISDRLNRLKRAFPTGALHAVAVKTNPLTAVLHHLVSEGMGLEAASVGEVLMAANVGLKPEKLVFDSPAKTVAEIAYLSENFSGMRINADSLAELSRYKEVNEVFSLGLRVNPLVIPDTLAAMTVSTADSKFGVPISEREAIIDACSNCQSLDSLHMHIGSQYKDFQPVIEAIRLIISLANEINTRVGYKKISTLDIGGGFPVNYGEGSEYLVENYAHALENSCPELYNGTYKVVTEFGRYVHANAAWIASRIEYVKPKHDGDILISHAGADMFLREAYSPDDWHHKMLLMNKNGNVKENNMETTINTDVAGPLCFGGDFLGKNVQLPHAQAGDVLAVRDAGANTFALWSRHCSRPFPKVIASKNGKMTVIKQRESFQNIIDFWS